MANADEKFPYVCTTYSCTEHWCSGFTRWQPWLLEMQPEAYLEIGENLAGKLGIKNGEKVKVVLGPGRDEVRGHGHQTPETLPDRRQDRP